MTLVAAWIRRTPGGEELVVASDSRVTGGIQLDHAPKIFRLDRKDAVLAYCGSTLVAYPILLQIKASLDGSEETRNRITDIVNLKSHIEKAIELLRTHIQDLPSKDNTHRSFKFMLAGYSWRTSSFRVWTFKYDINSGEFNAFKMPRSNKFVFMSDTDENELRARDTLCHKYLRKEAGNGKRLNWEPLQVLLQIINDNEVYDVGGPPQIVKIYKHANTLPINVIWPEEQFKRGILRRTFCVTHLGRPLLKYERSRYLSLDPQTLEFIEPWKTQDVIRSYNDRAEAQLRTHYRIVLCKVIMAIKDKKALQKQLTEMVAIKCTSKEILQAIQDAKFAQGCT